MIKAYKKCRWRI